MPGGDKTGPLGQGPMTGRGLGFCSGNATPGYKYPGFGRRIGRRGGRGRGFWHPNYSPGPFYANIQPNLSKEEQINYLETILKDLESEIKDIKQRIKELSN